MEFADKLLKASQRNSSWLCIGLDPDPQLMPEKISILDFNKAIIEATSDLVCAYKPNLAFYEALGMEGFDILQKTLKHIPAHIPTIGDGKRSDIGNTAKAYARALFDTFSFDAATVNPYLGFDSVEPFINYKDKMTFILCRTSNPGAVDFQGLFSSNGMLLYEIVAQKAQEWNNAGNIGLVVGATYPQELKRIRELCPEMFMLIPGIGAQGGDLASVIKFGVDTRGERAIVAISRQVLYASREADFAKAARHSAQELRDSINDLISQSSH